MKIFAIDSPLMRVLGKISDLMILNILTLLCCIPLVTAGAAFTAMHYVSLKMVRGEESGITKMFFHSFKDNLKQSTVIWILFLLVAAIFGLNFMLLYANPTEVSTFVFGGSISSCALILFITSMVWPVQARFANTIPRTLKTAFVFSFRYFPRTLLILISSFVPFALYLVGNLGLMLTPLIFTFGFSGPAYLAAMLYSGPFRKAEEAYYESHPEDAPDRGSDEERIFTDVDGSDS
ncbi:MAG: YesL family protein [Lachnospiraceae bacterium]|nr:YesL family protein [Lachnospiraceae bacterium]